jgi:hypothetical protein
MESNMARPTTLPEQAQAVHLPDHLPAIPPEVTLPDAAADAIAAAADHIAEHLPDWFPLATAKAATAQAATAEDHRPAEVPPHPPVDVALPGHAVSHLTDHLPTDHANVPDWLFPLV